VAAPPIIANNPYTLEILAVRVERKRAIYKSTPSDEVYGTHLAI
jgi:hypothetical protein